MEVGEPFQRCVQDIKKSGKNALKNFVNYLRFTTIFSHDQGVNRDRPDKEIRVSSWRSIDCHFDVSRRLYVRNEKEYQTQCEREKEREKMEEREWTLSIYILLWTAAEMEQPLHFSQIPLRSSPYRSQLRRISRRLFRFQFKCVRTPNVAFIVIGLKD